MSASGAMSNELTHDAISVALRQRLAEIRCLHPRLQEGARREAFAMADRLRDLLQRKSRAAL